MDLWLFLVQVKQELTSLFFSTSPRVQNEIDREMSHWTSEASEIFMETTIKMALSIANYAPSDLGMAIPLKKDGS